MTRTLTKLNSNGYETTLIYQRAVVVCFGFMILFSAVYAYAICSTVHFVIARTQYQSESENMGAQLGTLQAQYVAESETITPDLEASLGLSQPADISFVNQALPSSSQLSFVDTHEL